MEKKLQRSNAGENISIAALVLGIISIIVAFIPCINIVAIITSLLTIIFAAIGLNKAITVNAPKVLPKISLILGIVALVFSIILTFVFGAIFGALSFWD